MTELITGATVMACLVAGLFFWKFWRREHDRLFALFALAFWIMGLNRLVAALVGPANEARTWPYVIRLAAFLIILAAIVDKNRTSGRTG
jgi:hypothetical protein